jgi:hypothetical protein
MYRIAGTVATVLILSADFEAQACQCEQPPPAVARDDADMAFSGEVVLVEDPLDEPFVTPTSNATVRVEQCWKGGLREGDLVKVWTPSAGGSCGDAFTVGDHRVLFAVGDNLQILFTNWCLGNTIPVDWVLAELGPSTCTVAVEGKGWAAVKQLYRDP